MEIRKVGETSLKLISEYASILMYPSDKTAEIATDIVMGKNDSGEYNITSPGEYEHNEVWVLAFNTDVNKMENNVFVVTIEGVNYCILDSNIGKVSKLLIDKIGLIDVLIVRNDKSELKQLISNISIIGPQVLIPVGFEDIDVDKLATELGIKNISEEKKYKLNMDNFKNEDFQIQIVKL